MHLYNTTKGRLAKIIIQSSNYCVSSNPHDCDIVLYQLQNNPNIRGVAPLLCQAETMQQQLIKFERIYLRVTALQYVALNFAFNWTQSFFSFTFYSSEPQDLTFTLSLLSIVFYCVSVCAPGFAWGASLYNRKICDCLMSCRATIIWDNVSLSLFDVLDVICHMGSSVHNIPYSAIYTHMYEEDAIHCLNVGCVKTHTNRVVGLLPKGKCLQVH